MFDFIKDLFSPNEKNILISRQVISLEDNEFSDNSIFFSAEGDCVRKVKSTDELFEEFGFLVDLVKNRALSSDCFIDYELEILPVIKRFISIVNVAPSEHSVSSVFTTQLIRQALLGVIKFSEIYNKSSLAVSTGSQNFFESFYLVLTLNLYRFHNRFRITTPGKNFEFNLFKHDSLEEFIRIHKASHLRFYQRRSFDSNITFDNCFMHLAAKCPMTHECLRRSPEYIKLRKLTMSLSFSKDELRFNSQEQKPQIDNLFLIETNLKNMLLKADEISAYLCAHDGGCVLDLGVYLRRFLSSGIINEKTEGVFVLENGFVIEEGSVAHYLIYKAVERYYTDLTFFSNFNENLKDFELKNEFLCQKDETFLINDHCGRKNDFYELVLNSEYLFSNLYKRKSRWISLIKDRKTYLVRGFELYFRHKERLTAVPYSVVDLRSMNEHEALLKTLRCITIRSYDPTYIEFKPLKGPLHFCFLGEPLDSLIELDKIRFSVTPSDKDLKLKSASKKEVESFLTEKYSDCQPDLSSLSKENAISSDCIENSCVSEKIVAAEADSNTKKKNGRISPSKSPKSKRKIDAEISSVKLTNDDEISKNPVNSQHDRTLSPEELCALEKELISNFNLENQVQSEDISVTAVKKRKTKQDLI